MTHIAIVRPLLEWRFAGSKWEFPPRVRRTTGDRGPTLEQGSSLEVLRALHLGTPRRVSTPCRPRICSDKTGHPEERLRRAAGESVSLVKTAKIERVFACRSRLSSTRSMRVSVFSVVSTCSNDSTWASNASMACLYLAAAKAASLYVEA